MVFGRNPDKLDQKAIAYDQKGKTAKATKCREKAANLRLKKAESNNSTGFSSNRSVARYEQNALKWEQRGNFTKAQKNREKAWRLQNPQYGPDFAVPMFYTNNVFSGYNVQTGGVAHTSASVLPPVVETHVRPTIVEQTVRHEKITEVQPVIHREIDAPQVRVVEQHSYERVPSTGPAVVTNAAIVQETVKPRIIEEVQPVVHREVPVTHVQHVEQHVTEHIAQPATVTKQVVQDKTVHTAAGGPVGIAQTTTTTTSTHKH